MGILRARCHFRMKDERREVRILLSLFYPFSHSFFQREKILWVEDFFLFFKKKKSFSCRRANFKQFSHHPDQAEYESEQKQASEGRYKVWKVRSVRSLWRVS